VKLPAADVREVLVEGEVTDGCEIIEVAEAVAGVGQFKVSAAQLLVLHFQFDLVDVEFLDEPAGLGGGERRGFRPPG
jgi:hypothetical protein